MSNKQFKINDRVKFTEGKYAGAVGIVEQMQDEFDDQQAAALVTVSGQVNGEPVQVTDWFFVSELEIAA